jgi:hypothetical protein
MKSPYNDKNGNPLSIGDKIIGRTNFDRVQAVVYYDESGKNDFEKWRIRIFKQFNFIGDRWVEGFSYSLYLAYHIDENNNCTSYEKIKEFV